MFIRQLNRVTKQVRSFATVVDSNGAVVDKVKIAKSDPSIQYFTPVTPKKSAPASSLRSRISSFLAGFAVASLFGYSYLRGDVLEVTQHIEQQVLPVSTTLRAQIGRLENRIQQLEQAQAQAQAAAAAASPAETTPAENTAADQ